MAETISDYLGKLSKWRRDFQGRYPETGGPDLQSDCTALITAREMLSTANDPSSSATAGLAGVGTMCDACRSSSSLQHYNPYRPQ